MDIEQISARLSLLERENQRWRKSTVALTFLLLAVAGFGFRSAQQPGELKVRKLVVVGENGTPLIILRGPVKGKGESSISLNDLFGEEKVSIKAHHRYGALDLGESTARDKEANFVSVTASSFGSEITAQDHDGSALKLSASHGRGAISFENAKGKTISTWP